MSKGLTGCSFFLYEPLVVTIVFMDNRVLCLRPHVSVKIQYVAAFHIILDCPVESVSPCKPFISKTLVSHTYEC
jgi:hypothetical protein